MCNINLYIEYLSFHKGCNTIEAEALLRPSLKLGTCYLLKVGKSDLTRFFLKASASREIDRW